MFESIVGRRAITRRDALRLGAGALALGALKPPGALAAPRLALFELALDDGAAHAAGGWRTTAVLRAPRRFDLIGLRWARGAHPEAQVRARRRGGAWTAWATLHPLGDHGPDHARALPGTDPAFVGTADEFQLRLRGAAPGLRARFVSALPAATLARRITGRLRTRAAARSQGAIAVPQIISRSEWGGDSIPPRNPPVYGTVQLAFVHHTVTANDYNPEDAAGIVLGIARYHRDSNGWNDIGYNFLVDKYGQVFEGRAGGVEAAVVGAQAQGYNAQSAGVACLGDYTAITQSEAGMDALARLIGWKLSIHGVPVQGAVTLVSAGGPTNRYAAGTPVTLQRISGHRDGDQTSCPGELLYGQLADLRNRATRYSALVSGVTVRASSSHQRGTTPVALSGALRFADGSSPAGAALDVEYTAAGSAWTRMGTTSCAADGAWATTIALPASGKVRVVFPGDGARSRLESPAIAVTVVPSLTLTTDRRRARAGTAFAVSGTMAPSEPRIQCVLERKVGSRWVTIQRKRINVRGGRYATRARPGRPGLYRVSVVATGVTRRRLLRARSS